MKHPLLLALLLAASCGGPQDTAAPPPSLREMAGQMIMAGFRGMSGDSLSPQFLAQLDSGYLGGVILFDYDLGTQAFERNIRSPEQVEALIRALQQRAPVPLLVAVDQEGGRVNRLKPRYGFAALPSAQYLGSLNVLDSTRHYAQLNAANLRRLGFNVNFAPVVDLDLNPDNPVIGGIERSFSGAAETVVAHAGAWIGAHQEQGVLSVLKHFPGHGSSAADSHVGFTDITPYWSAEELRPFEALAKHKALLVGIMTAHVFNGQLDSLYPATLSRAVIHDILRTDWGFEGLIFSDDLQMKAVSALFDFEAILQRSIEAGVDVLVFGNNLEYDEAIPRRAVELIVQLVESGAIEEARIRASYERIMGVKRAK